MKVLVLAGGSDQIALIKELKDRGHEVVLIDYLENPPAKPFADKHIVASTLDKESVLHIAQKENVELVITACTDQAILTMAYASEKMGLKCYLTYNQALQFTNKLYMKELMIKNGIPTSQYVIPVSPDEFSLKKLKYPLVVKPVDNNSSKGILKIYNKDELNNAIRDALSYSRSKKVIVEEYKNGEEYSIDAFILNKKPKIIIETKYKKITTNEKFTIIQSSYPSHLSSIVIKKIERIISDISDVFNVDNIPLFMQLIIDGNDVNVVEFSARTGGGSKLHFIQELVGVNIIQNLLDITFGKVPNIKVTHKYKHAAICFIYAKAGIFYGVQKIEELKQQGIIHSYYFYKTLGMKIKESGYSSDRPASFFVIADSEQELNEKIVFVDRNIQILNEKGEDIMLHGIYNS